MIRPFRYVLAVALLVGVAWVSFAGGQRLRRVAAGPVVRQNTRVSALPDASIGIDLSRGSYQGDDSDPAQLFDDVAKSVHEKYVDPVTDDRKLTFSAIRNMLAALDDPKTRFYDPKQVKALQDQMNGRFSGIGAVISVERQKRGDLDVNRVTVVSTVPGGPAEKAGLLPGDVITELDGRWVIAYDPLLDLGSTKVQDMDNEQYRQAREQAIRRITEGMSLPKALDELAAAGPKPLTLTVERRGASAPLKLQVARTTTESDPVEFRPINDTVAYLRVTQLSDRAAQEVSQALRGAKQRALVLDLRGNAGGPVTGTTSGPLGAAKQLVSLLAGGGQMGELVRKGNRIEPIQAPAGSGGRYKVVVLVNGGTANIAELLASGLKDRAGAKLVGARTFGDSSFEKLVELRDGAAMTVRAGKLLVGKGTDFGGKGLDPDVAMATGGPRATDDPAVNRAVGLLGGA